MRTRLVALLLVLLNLWQVASAAGLPQFIAAQGEALEHTMMHWQGETHHHDSDGSIHVDASEDSFEHMMADCCFHWGVIVAPAVLTLEPLPQHVSQTAQAVPPPPYLDGLRRPPRILS